MEWNLLKPLRTTALTAACLAIFALGACSDGDTAAAPPADGQQSSAPAEDAPTAADLLGKWDYNAGPQSGVVTSFTVDADGTVTEFWKEGTIGEMSATLAVGTDGTYTLVWKAESDGAGNSGGTYLLTPDSGGDSLTAEVVGGTGRTFTFTRAA